MKFGAQLPEEYFLWTLAEATGWSLEYIRALPAQEFWNWLAVRDGRNKARHT